MIVNKIQDLIVNFGGIEMNPFRLVFSTVDATQLEIVAPPGEAGVVTVIVLPTRLNSNSFSFEFTYFDDRKPIIIDYSPFQFYEEGGDEMRIKIRGFVFDNPSNDVREEINIGVRNGLGLAPVLHPSEAVVDFDSVSLSFVVPEGLKGMATVVVSKGSMITDPSSFEYVLLPREIPRVLSVLPHTIRNDGKSLVEIVLEDFKLIKISSNVIISFIMGVATARVESASNPAVQIVSTMSQTTITLPSPVFQEGGNATMFVWESGRENQTASANILIENVQQSQIVSVYPSKSVASRSHAVDVTIKRFGTISSVEQTFVALHDPAVGSATITEYWTTTNFGEDDFMNIKVSMTLLGDCYVPFDVSVGNCPEIDTCPLKTIRFTVHLLNPQGVYVLSAAPLTSSVDGMNFMTVIVNNLAKDLTSQDLSLKFGSNLVAEIMSIKYFASGSVSEMEIDDTSPTWKAKITCIVPRTTIAEIIDLSLDLISSSETLSFPERFQYTKEVEPRIISVEPMSARISVPAAITMTVQSFPGVSEISDIVIEIRCGGGVSESALVETFSRIDQNEYFLATQEYRITGKITSDSLKQGTCQIVLYNLRWRYREAYLDGFRVVDDTLPQMSGISSEHGETGIDHVKVKMSQSTELRVMLRGSSSAVKKILIENQGVETKFASYDASEKSGVAVFSSPPRAFETTRAFGLLFFSRACACETSCCSSSTCSSCAC